MGNPNTPTTMTARELRDQLNRMFEARPDDWDLDVYVQCAEPGIPTAPMAAVRSVGEGFDWTHGKLIIDMATPVVRKKYR